MPVLSTSVGEIATVIENNVTGILITSEDIDAFYSELIKLIDNPEKRKLLANKFNEHVTANYSEKAVISKYLDWLVKEGKD
jgi:glycosyltransferase involved in cell wall biosynthesis